jgi:hypothetical protein
MTITTEEMTYILLTKNEVNISGKDNRRFRKVMSDLRKQGILFIPLGRNGDYKRIEHCTQHEIDRYANEQIKSLITQYNNTVKPLKNYINSEMLKELHEGGLYDEN